MAPAIAYAILTGLLGSAIWFRIHTLDHVQDESTFGEWPRVPDELSLGHFDGRL